MAIAALFLVAVTFGLSEAVCTKYKNISVSNVAPSADTANCLNGRSTCKTLEYALSNVTNCTYVSINCSGPLVVKAPVNVGNVHGLLLAGVSTQRVLCSEGAGIAFQAVSDVQIVGLYWSQCSIRHPTFSSNGRSSSVVFIESADITIKDNSFTTSYGTGLSLYNVGGTVTVQNCSFLNNTIIGCAGTSCDEDSQGLHIEFGCYNNTCGLLSLHNSNALIILENNSFLLNNNPYSETQQPLLDYSTILNSGLGGGLAVIIKGNSLNNTIIITGCTFENNSALLGAGLAFMVLDAATSNEISILQSSQFTSNSAAQAGGGILLVLTTTAVLPNNSITVSASFVSNSASLGGAMACYSAYQSYPNLRNSLTITQSSFSMNIAYRGGSALSLVTLWSRDNGGYPLVASMDQSNITYNIISALSPYGSSSSVVGVGTVYLELSSLAISSVLFNWNVGTALFLSSSFVTLQGNVEFGYNYAINGAAVYLSGVSWLTLTRGLQLRLEGNYALQYGGGLYQDFPLPGVSGEWWDCIIRYENSSVLVENWEVNVTFFNNSAQRGGSSIYTSNPESCIREGDSPPFTNSRVYNFLGSNAAEQVSNPPSTFYSNQTSANVWLGQIPQLNAYALSIFNQSMAGTVLAALDYSGSSLNLSLGGNSAVQLNSVSATSWYVTGPQSLNNTENAKVIIYSTQQPLTITRIAFNVTQCPFGCPYNVMLKVCMCKSTSAIQCENNVCCIKYGYWYGKFETISGIDVYEGDVCPRGFCSYNGNGLCPKNSCPFISGYCKLPQTADDICADNRGGAFCSYCTDGNSFTYDATKCVDNSRCSPGYKVLLVLILFLYWAVLTGVIIFALKFKFRVGSGRLYCVLYYFSIINYFVGNNYPTTFLQVSVDLISGIVLQPRFIGSINLCISEGILPVQVIALSYIHPLFFLLLVIGIIFMARYFKTIAMLKSTSQAVCLLILLSHTSLVETSITILRPVTYSHLEGGYVGIQPTTQYFDPSYHLPYAVIAIIILLVNIPLSVLLFLTPWLVKYSFFKMDKIKPILDEFQGCYRDEYRSFAGFYLIVRELIYVVSLFPNLKVYGAIYTYQWISIMVVIIHAMVQPYKEKWLNILDTVLLANLVAVSLLFGGTAYTLFGQNNDSRNFHVFLVHIFVLMPVTYAVMLGAYLLSTRLWKYAKKRKSVTLNEVAGMQLQSPGQVVNGTQIDIDVLENMSGNQSSGSQPSGESSSSSGKQSSEKQAVQQKMEGNISQTLLVVNKLDDRRDSVIFH